MPIRRGVHKPLEDAADALIKQALSTVTRHADKADILTPWKEQERKRKEVMVPSGTPDPSVRSGIFHRALNPEQGHLNSRQGSVRGHRISQPYSAVSEMPTAGFAESLWDQE